MLVLALDTTGHRGSFALVRGSDVITSRVIEVPEGFGSAVYQNVADLVQTAGVALTDLDGIAAAAGPGSFTGIRVGLAAAKALAEALGKPVAPVSNLEALAAAVPGPLRAPVLDARRGEVFAALYDGELRAIIEPAVLAWPDFEPRAALRSPLWVTYDAAVFEPGGAAPLPAGAERLVVDNLAEAIGRLAVERLSRGLGLNPEQVDAGYIRRPDAERNWKGL